MVALSANKNRRRKSWDWSPSHPFKQPAVDGEKVHTGTGTVAVLWGKIFLVFLNWNNSALSVGQGPIPSWQSSNQHTHSGRLWHTSIPARQSKDRCAASPLPPYYFCKVRLKLIFSCFIAKLLANSSRSSLWGKENLKNTYEEKKNSLLFGQRPVEKATLDGPYSLTSYLLFNSPLFDFV